mgnify:CR=1 FL=1
MGTKLIQSRVENQIGWIALNNTRRKKALLNTMYESILS